VLFTQKRFTCHNIALIFTNQPTALSIRSFNINFGHILFTKMNLLVRPTLILYAHYAISMDVTII